MKNLFSMSALVVILCFFSTADAQRPGGGRGGQRGGPPGGGRPQQDMNQGNFQGNQAQQGFGNRAAMNQNGNQNMPTVAELAQMMISNFDADGSGELGEAELQSALTALRERMQNRGGRQQGGMANQQNGMANRQNGMANQQNANQGRRNMRGDQAQGNQARPQRGQVGARRGR